MLFHGHSSTTCQRFATLCSYLRAKSGNSRCMYHAAFADASHRKDTNQLSIMVGLLFVNVIHRSEFHILALSSHKSRRPVRSSSATKILATREAIDETCTDKCTLKITIESSIQCMVLIDSEDMYHLLYSQRNSIEKSIWADVNSIRYHYDTSIEAFGWNHGNKNPTNVVTKLNSTHAEAPASTLVTDNLQFDWSSMDTATRKLHVA